MANEFKTKFFRFLVVFINIIIIGLIVYAAWQSRNDTWFWPLLILCALLYFQFKDIFERISKLEKGREGISDYIRNNKYEDIDIDIEDIGFKLQRIIFFSFEPNSICEKIGTIVNMETDSIVEKIIKQARQINIKIIDYTDDLRMFKTSILKKGKEEADEIINYENIDYPKPNNYPWEIEIDFDDFADDILFSYDLNDNRSGFRNRLYIGSKVSEGKEIITIFIQIHDENNKCKNIMLKEIPIYGEFLEKHSILEDKYGMKKKFKMYEQDDRELGAYWRLYIVEHEHLVDYRKKFEEFKRNKQTT
jgi:hypothetical protein